MNAVEQPSPEGKNAFSLRFERYRASLAALAILAVFAAMAYAIYRVTEEVRYENVLGAFGETPVRDILLAAGFTALSFAALIRYDANALDYIGRKVPAGSVAVIAFMSYAIGNTVGFGALSGGAIRFRAYARAGLQPGEIGRVLAFVTLSFGLSLAAITSLAVLAVAPRIAAIVGMEPLALQAGAVLCLGLLGLLFFAGRNGREFRLFGFTLHLPDSRTTSRQFLISVLDIAASASTLYVLLPETHVGWPTFLAVYATAIGLGMLSHVPAGLGVFEAVIMAGLSHAISLEQLLGALLLYRVIYYILPLLLAVLLLLGTETRQIARRPELAGVVQVAAKLAPALVSAFALLTGTILIFSSVVPTGPDNLDYLAQMLPLPIVEGAHFMSSMLGLAMVISARGLGQRLDGAWWVATGAVTAALFLAFPTAAAWHQFVLLAVLLVALVLNRHAFDRPANLFGQALGPSWIAGMGVILLAAFVILLFVYRDTQYTHELWWQFEFSSEAPRGLRALLGVSIGASAVAMFSLLRPAPILPAPPGRADLERAVAIAMAQDNADANLVRMGDKHLLFSETGRSFLMYGIQGRSWIALADPVGEEEEFADLVWRFVELARTGGGRAAFYQISPALLSSCVDAGLRAFKLGELATVDLEAFDLRGSRNSGLRQSYNRGLRDGLSFELIAQADVRAGIDALKAVSDGWLAHHNTREKTFSLGAFDPDYVASQPVAAVRLDGRLVAFATLMVTDTRAEGTIDLMRFLPDAPKATMDFLFVSILERLKADGYRRFNLGMAPLSGMARREAAPVWDRLGGTLFEHGERFYNFKGLRAFKSKFHPRWEPRYLAVSNGTGAALALVDVTLLIGGGVKGVISK
ncbi:bifunctional lysylphosphatidylglycerol flippase/synthetase MprF [Gellertiella hungarica]|uniref:Phosphatidylglycerol lysyltransferase n=1 Tax=Gellertiella hungarica TaxID=1572859 RepID=A0A7W6J8C7_9HYPH|nr:bifunctional lysylphosphatidylglycerol flippase/synthetase MprF [Gellertiella hungarica]MBB4066661.1 phosphatidylglycerol lysyltransferase [Gellertiella hungarica]